MNEIVWKSKIDKIVVPNTDYRWISVLFMDVFKMKLNECIDELNMRSKSVKIDLDKFEAKLQEIHPFDDNSSSLSDVVKKHYGIKGLTLIKMLL